MTGLQTGIITAAWAGTMGVAFFAGLKWIPPGTDRESEFLVEPGPAARPADFAVRQSPGLAAGEIDWEQLSSFLAGTGSDRMANLAARIGSALSEEDAVRRSLALGVILETLSPSNLGEIREAFEEAGMDWQRAAEIQMFLHAWARFDPAAAMSYAYEQMDGRRGAFIATGVLRSWAGRDWDAAYHWADAQENPQSRMMALSSVIGAKAENDPAEAARLALDLQTGRGGDWLIRNVAEEYSKQDPRAAIGWASSIPDENRRNDALQRIASSWMESDPSAATHWARSNPNTPEATAIARRHSASLAETSPRQAIDWARSLPEGETRDRGVAAAIGRWAQTDPNAAGTYLNSLPKGAATDTALEAFARRVSADDPVASLAWASSIADEQTRNRTIIEIGRYLNSQDPEAARDWAASSSLGDEVRNAILSRRGGRPAQPPWSRLD